VQRDGRDIAFRPHAVTLRTSGAASQEDGLSLSGEIEAVEFLGEFVRYDVKVGDTRVTADVSHARGRAPLLPGTAVTIGVPATELRRLD
jgi:iron(III) transport system ATP-binding protein